MTEIVSYIAVTCAYCGTEFRWYGRHGTPPTYCSRPCATHSARLRQETAVDDEPSPATWDGVTMHSEVIPTARLAAVCLHCGERYANYRRTRCVRCQGPCLAEHDDIGSISSPQFGHSESYAKLARGWAKG